MKKNHLRKINGDKIRWQYFTWPLLILLYSAIATPCAVFVGSLSLGKFDASECLSALRVSVEVCLILATPFIILYVLNQQFFGKIICVINENGIHHKDGLIKWEDITKIEYEVELYGTVIEKEHRFCHAVIYTEKQNIILLHAPMYFIFKVKKNKASLDAKISKSSKWTIGFFLALPIIASLVILLFK